MENETFEQFWEDVLSFSKETGLSTQYIEEEFILDGVLHKVYLQDSIKEETINE